MMHSDVQALYEEIHEAIPYYLTAFVMEWAWEFHNASIHSLTNVLFMPARSDNCVSVRPHRKFYNKIPWLPDKGAKLVFHGSFYDSLAFGLIIKLWQVT